MHLQPFHVQPQVRPQPAPTSANRHVKGTSDDSSLRAFLAGPEPSRIPALPNNACLPASQVHDQTLCSHCRKPTCQGKALHKARLTGKPQLSGTHSTTLGLLLNLYLWNLMSFPLCPSSSCCHNRARTCCSLLAGIVQNSAVSGKSHWPNAFLSHVTCIWATQML